MASRPRPHRFSTSIRTPGLSFGESYCCIQMSDRRFPPPWSVVRLPGGFKVIDANGQSLAYFYARENDHDANTAGVLTMDEARRMASNFAQLPVLLTR